jgi:hypothetical protein
MQHGLTPSVVHLIDDRSEIRVILRVRVADREYEEAPLV